MKDFICYNCEKKVRMAVSDEGNYFWSCGCKAIRISIFDRTGFPFQWRHPDYKKRKSRGDY